MLQCEFTLCPADGILESQLGCNNTKRDDQSGIRHLQKPESKIHKIGEQVQENPLKYRPKQKMMDDARDRFFFYLE